MIQELRKNLHVIPEGAFREYQTKHTIVDFLQQHTDLKIEDCGSWFYAFYQGATEDAIAFRADIDAVCGKDGRYRHSCGHDGHAAVLAGTAVEVSRMKPRQSVVFIFQPAEETGEGARLCRGVIEQRRISEIFGFHNIPCFKKNSVLLMADTFACASTGLEIRVHGAPSHAAYPEAGKNPAAIIANLILNKEKYISGYDIPVDDTTRAYKEKFSTQYKGLVQMTVVGVDMGSDSYGVSAGEGTLRLTLRGEYEEEFQRLVRTIIEDAKRMCTAGDMECEFRRIEEFPATENHPDSVNRVREAAKKLGMETITPQEPFRWSEDFGYYLQRIPGAFFGIGVGENWPQLHTDEYEFPDDIIETGIRIFLELVEQFEKTEVK